MAVYIPGARASSDSAFWSTLPRDPAENGFAQANVYMDQLHMRSPMQGGLNYPWTMTKYPPPIYTYPQTNYSLFSSRVYTGDRMIMSAQRMRDTQPSSGTFIHSSPHPHYFAMQSRQGGYSEDMWQDSPYAFEGGPYDDFPSHAYLPSSLPAPSNKKVTSLMRRLHSIGREIQELRSEVHSASSSRPSSRNSVGAAQVHACVCNSVHINAETALQA
jgi:hypothetical protein